MTEADCEAGYIIKLNSHDLLHPAEASSRYWPCRVRSTAKSSRLPSVDFMVRDGGRVTSVAVPYCRTGRRRPSETALNDFLGGACHESTGAL